MTLTYLKKVPSNRDFRRKDSSMFLNAVSDRSERVVKLCDGMSSLVARRQSPYISISRRPVYRSVNVRHEIAFHGSFLVIGRSIVVVVLFSAP